MQFLQRLARRRRVRLIFRIGTIAAVAGGMAGARRFEDLIAWQRMYELSIEIWKATDRPPASRDFDFRNQIRDASDSAQRNIAEGFGRFNPAQFVHFLDIARASAMETKALLKKGLAVGYWQAPECERLEVLADRGLQAVAKLQRYLRSSQAKLNAAQRYRKPPNDPNVPNDPNDPND